MNTCFFPLCLLHELQAIFFIFIYMRAIVSVISKEKVIECFRMNKRLLRREFDFKLSHLKLSHGKQMHDTLPFIRTRALKLRKPVH